MEELFNFVLHEEKYRITVGNQVVSSKKFDTLEQAETYANQKPWELISNLQVIVANIVWKQNHEKDPATRKPKLKKVER